LNDLQVLGIGSVAVGSMDDTMAATASLSSYD
jgi:hypothetical protein